MAMLSLCGLSEDTLFKSKSEVEENEAFETFQNDNTINQMNLYSLPGNVSVNYYVMFYTRLELTNIYYVHY